MTQQFSSKYKKFMVGAASAALVTSVVAPVASAKEFKDTKGNTHEKAIDALSDAGIISGYPDGTFQPNKTLTRSDVVKLMGKWLVSEGYEIPKDYKTNPRFSDLTPNSNDELLQSAAIVKDNGVFNGNNGRLLAADNITRENMAVVLVRAFDQKYGTDLVSYVEAQDFKKDVIDLNKAKAEARPAIDVLDYFDITNPTAPAFNPKSTTTRGQFATFLYKTMNTVSTTPILDKNLGEALNLVKDGSVTVSRGEYATDANKLVAVQAYVDGLVKVEGVVAKATAGKTAGNYVVTLTKGEDKVEKTIAVTFEFAADDRFVTEVNALNATQVEVKFNVAVDANDITNKTTIQGVKFTGQSLSEDGKVLKLTAGNPINVTGATVVVEPVKTKADAKVKTDKFVSTLTYKDTVAPTIASVEAKTSGDVATSLTIKASEPLKAKVGLVKLNGSYVEADFNGTDVATISGLSLDAGKTHTIELINIEDLASNKTVSTSANFTVNVDATTPSVTLAANGEKEILVTFDKSMKVKTVTEALKNGSVKDEALANVTTGTVTEVAGSKGTQFIIPVTESIFANKVSRIFSIILSAEIQDSLGNKIEPTTQKVTLTKDTVKPTATGHKVIKDNEGRVTAIEVNFSEGLAAGTPTLPTIVSENGVAVRDFLGGLTAKAIQAGDTKVVYNAKTAEKVSGKYAFSFAKNLVADQAETANNSDAFNYTIDFGQEEVETTFDLTSATAAKNVITVTFPEAVKGGAVANSATDVANYSLAGKPLPAETTITLDTAQKVSTITLPAESVEKTDQAVVLTVENIQSTTGKSLKTYKGTVGVEDNTSPKLVSAKVLNTKEIEITYNEAIDLGESSNVSADFTILQGSTALTLGEEELTISEVSGFPNRVKVTFATTSLDVTKEITLETKASEIVKDAAGNTQKEKEKVVATR